MSAGTALLHSPHMTSYSADEQTLFSLSL